MLQDFIPFCGCESWDDDFRSTSIQQQLIKDEDYLQDIFLFNPCILSHNNVNNVRKSLGYPKKCPICYKSWNEKRLSGT